MKRGLDRSFLAGRSMGVAVCTEREETVSLLIIHRLELAAHATRISATSSYSDFYTMRGAMLAGGLHCVRLRGGRGIDR